MCLCLPGWKSQFYKDCATDILILGREQSEHQYLNFAVTYDPTLRSTICDVISWHDERLVC
jgi:hypothetical protein